MATILELRAMAGRTIAPRTATGSIGAASAEIVLFPGVRYERWAEADPDQAAKPKRRRDKLELED